MSSEKPPLVSWDPPASELDLGYQIYERQMATMHLQYWQQFTIPIIEGWLDPVSWTRWYQAYWHYSLYISVLYLLCIVIGERLMRHRKAFQLDGVLFYWNLSLALFSILGSIRCAEELIGSIRKYDFDRTFCYSCNPYDVCAVWHWYFGFSKVVELGDTVFLVLKKRPVLFLHWFHHVTVLVYTWHSAVEHSGVGRYFISLNLTVHAFMYSYYALKSSKYGRSVPTSVSIVITLGQIAQMVMGISLTYKVMQLKRSGVACQQSSTNLYFAISIYGIYFFLFVKFFVDAYIRKVKRKTV